MRLAGTGHRPDKLGGYDDSPLQQWVRQEIRAALFELKPDAVMSGMALGFDTWLAQEALGLGVPLHAAVPFEGQERKWLESSQQLYRALLKRCTTVTVVSSYPSKAAFNDRNVFMVDWLQAGDTLLACWNGSDGGTNNCIKYAMPRCTLGLNEARFPPHPHPINLLHIDPNAFVPATFSP